MIMSTRAGKNEKGKQKKKERAQRMLFEEGNLCMFERGKNTCTYFVSGEEHIITLKN